MTIAKKKNMLSAAFAVLLLSGCKTVQFDKPTESTAGAEAGIHSLDDERMANKQAVEDYEIEENLKTVDIEGTVIYIDRPVYSPVETPEPRLTGAEAVEKSTSSALQIPMKFKNGIMFYPWDETFVYEVHCQPYRVTDLSLEPGEEVLEMPFLSEEKVWEVGAGVSRKDGKDVQHFFLKPSYSALVTSMIIITNRRVYHILLKSYKDRYMTMVQWEYPPAMPFTVKQNSLNTARNGVNSEQTDLGLVNAQYLSFDYKMTYSVFKKPVWLPKRVYDDGRKTYIEMDEKMLNMEAPALFNQKNERVNYRADKNLIVIDELITKVTLRRGDEKVTIVKKRHHGKAAAE